MKKILRLFFILGLIILSIQTCNAQDNKVLVLPDNIDFSSTNYLVYPDSAIIFASDTINEIKKEGKLETVSMTEVRDTLRKNTKLHILTKNAIKEYKYNYNIPFVDFRAIAHAFSTNKVLIITSQTDIQNYFLRRTIWDYLNIPGAAVIDPAYKLSTYASLIDVDKELVIWEGTYYKNISSMESRIVAQNFAPATEQMEKIKGYSSLFLAPNIAKKVAAEILLPPTVLPENDKNIINVSNIKSNAKLPHRDFVDDPDFDLDFRPRNIKPKKNTQSPYGESVNDL